MDRRRFLMWSGAALVARGAAPLVGRVAQRRVLTLVYDKSIGAMRAIDRLVP